MPEQVAGAIKELIERLDGVRAGGKRELTPKEELVLRLNKQYPLDVGVLSAFFLNLVTLKAGQVSLALLTEWIPGLRVRRYLELNNNKILWYIFHCSAAFTSWVPARQGHQPSCRCSRCPAVCLCLAIVAEHKAAEWADLDLFRCVHGSCMCVRDLYFYVDVCSFPP